MTLFKPRGSGLQSWQRPVFALLILPLLLMLVVFPNFRGGLAVADDAPSWPERAITVVVPFAPGGGGDILARTLQSGLSAELGKPVVIVNKSGAGGMVGADFVARSAPDGYTLLLGNSASQAIAPSMSSNPLYDPVKDFAPITVVAKITFLVIVRADAPYNSIQELIAYAKQNPGKVFYGSAGVGTPPHLAGEMLKKLTGADIVHVPFRGMGPATVALLGGQITMVIGDEPAYMPLVRGGQGKAIAVASAQHSALLPDLQTVAEAGVAGYDVSSWQAFLAPAGTPNAIIERVRDAVVKVMATPSVKASLSATGSMPVGNTPQEFATFLTAEIAKWGDIIKASHTSAN